MAKKILVTHMFKEATEDNYESGEIGKAQLLMDERVNALAAPGDIVQALAKTYGLNPDKNSWAIFDGRIQHQTLETDNSGEASKSEIEAWKRGRLRLWAVTYDFSVKVISEHKAGDAELHRLTGIEVH